MKENDSGGVSSMKRIFLVALMVFVSGTGYAAEGHMHEHRSPHDAAGKADSRVLLNLPDEMKVMQKAMMRAHLDTVAAITKSLAINDLKAAGGIAKNLGWNPDEEKRCANVAKITGEKDFLPLGMNLHKKADELAAYASGGDRDKALMALSELITRCNACHERFRH